MHLIWKRKTLKAQDLITLKHRSKWYIKNGWQVRTEAHLYYGWHGLGRGRFRVVLAKPVDIGDGWSRQLCRWYRWMGLPEMTVEDATAHNKGDWIRIISEGSETKVDQRKVIYIYRNRLIIGSEEQITRVAWIHLLASLTVGFLTAIVASELIIWGLGLNHVTYNNWPVGLLVGACAFCIAYIINKKLEEE